MRSVVSELIRQSRLMVVEEMSIDEPKTQLLRNKLTGMDLKEALIVTLDDDRNLNLASRNLYRVDAVQAASVDLVSLIAFSKVVITRDALKKIEERIQ
jgi:large subunit ribosomal protein L4